MIGRRIVTLVLALTVATGCSADDAEPTGGDTEPPSGSPSSDLADGAKACALLTQLEVSEAVGAEVGPGRGSGGAVATGGTQSTCEWFSVEQPGDTAKLTIYTEATAADSVKDADEDAVELPGVADKAFVGSYASVWAYKGDQSFMAQWYSMSTTDEENLPRSVALATLAADRL